MEFQVACQLFSSKGKGEGVIRVTPGERNSCMPDGCRSSRQRNGKHEHAARAFLCVYDATVAFYNMLANGKP